MAITITLLIYLLGCFISYGVSLGTTQATFPELCEGWWKNDVLFCATLSLFSWPGLVVFIMVVAGDAEFSFRIIPKRK